MCCVKWRTHHQAHQTSRSLLSPAQGTPSTLAEEVPISLACWQAWLGRCWQAWLEVSDECPCCRREITPEELHQLSRYLRSTLSGLLLHCDHWQRGCSAVVKLEELQAHVKECAFKLHPLLPEDIYRQGKAPPATTTPLTAEDMISAPVEAAAQPTGAQGSGLTDQTAGRGKGHNRWFADFHRRQAPAYILYTNVSDWKQVSVPQDERAKAPCHLAGAGSPSPADYSLIKRPS